MADQLKKLLFPQSSSRVLALHLDDAWQEMTRFQHLPIAVQRMAGELTSATIMMAAGFKFSGSVCLQLHGDGPVSLVAIEVRQDMTTRISVRLRDELRDTIRDDSTFQDLINATGKARFGIVLDRDNRPADEQPYVGIVEIQPTDTVVDCFERFMDISEQIKTRFWLFGDDQACGGLMLQQLPLHGGKEVADVDPDGFNTLLALCETIKAEEILQLSSETVCERLFWEQNPQHLEMVTPRFACRCSREGIERSVLRSIGKAEMLEIANENGGTVSVRCEFCGKDYVFDTVDIQAFFGKLENQRPVH